jgi:phenylalanyl-tRNA synthetase beta chain
VKFVRSSSEFCPYYTLRTLKNVKVGPSPEWLRRDLEAAGLRPINNVVDITNWVLLELGQPLHAFDAKKVSEGIEARPAREGEEIVLLDGKKVKLEAGVSRHRRRPAPARRGRRDGRRRFRRDRFHGRRPPGGRLVPPRRDSPRRPPHRRLHRFLPSASPVTWIRPASNSLRASPRTSSSNSPAPQAVGPAVVVGQPPRADVTIELPAGYVAEKLGTPVADADVNAAFARLGFTVKPSAAGFSVLVPSFRSDVTRPIDLVEEFIRIHGTDKVPAGRPIAPLPGDEDALTSVFTREVSARLVGAGFTECCHYSLR